MEKSYTEIPAVILTGGKSSRMGQDKALMQFHDSSMTQYLHNKLSRIFTTVYISSKKDKFDFLNSKENLILDNSDIYSPMVALDTILNTIKQEKIFIISVDTPLIKESTILKLIKISINSNFEMVIPKDSNGNRHSLCGVFSSSVKQKIKKCLNDDIHKINYLINSCSFKEVLFNDPNEFININTKEHYNRAKNLLKRQK